MSQYFSLKHYSGRTLILICILIFGFISSKALVSIATGLLLANLLLSLKSHSFNFVKMSVLPILAGSLFFLAYILLFLFAPSYKTALSQIWAKAPWIIIPFSVAAIEKPTKQTIDFIVALLIFIISISGVIVLINYYYNYSFHVEQIAVAKHIPTPLNHIRYSLMVAFSGAASLFYLIKNNTRLSPYDRKFFFVSSLFLFVLIHILSVRSGLLCYYFSLLYIFLYFSFQFKKWWILPLLILFLAATPYIAYHNIQSFHNKIDYMMYDFEQMQANNIGHNSDSRRLRSFQIAWELIKEKPVLGHGIGQIENVTQTYYLEHFPDVEEHNQKIPHNQFLFTWVELGLVGLLFLFASIAIPIVFSFLFKNPLYMSLSIIILASCLVENTFESQIGMSFYLIFASLFLKKEQNE